MERDEALIKLADELIFNIDSSEDEELTEHILESLGMAYGVGFNDGRKQVQQRTLRKVVQCTLMGQPIKLWNSINEASKALGIDAPQISKVANNKPGKKTAGGYKWKHSDV